MADIENYAELNALITKESGAPIVTKWLVLAELIDEDGDRRSMYISSDGCSVPDELGLTEYHKMWRQAGMPADRG